MLAALLLILAIAPARALDNGLGRTPLLGFNSWNFFACNVNETLMMATMDFFVTTGLRDAGYKMVSVDDCWAGSRAADGTIEADPASFPSGMAALAAYAHARGLQFGLYSSNSPKTCDQRPGSFGYEAMDASTYAAWGVDLLKYDNCGDQNVIGPPERGYAVMRDALNATGRPIFFAACEWAVDFPSTWMAGVANTWRTTYDIQNMWECIVPHLDWQNVFADFFGPGGFGDMDILEVGNGVLTAAESVSHFSLWAAMKSPLLIGCALSSADCQSNLTVFLNAEVLAVNQDALGKPARRVAASGNAGVPVGKSGTCGTEELAQNTVLAPCDAASPLQRWTRLANGTLLLGATGECLQLDSGQGGHCSQAWTVWTNNVASGLCDDPASDCGSRQQLWTYTPEGTLVNNASQQCLTVHAGGMHNVGAWPCAQAQAGLQTWDFVPGTGQFISSAAPPGGGEAKFCLARTPDVRGGAAEVWAGPLANGDTVVILFNRNMPAAANISATWADLGFSPAATYAVRDLWLHQALAPATGAITLPVEYHGVRVLRLTPA